MARSVAPPSRRPPGGVTGRLGRLAAVAGLVVSAYLHATLASGPLVAAGQVTLAGLFLAQAVVAGLVALWLAVRPSRLAAVAALGVGAASLLALVLSVYVRLPAVGPFPVLYEPEWYPEKVAAAAAAAVAAVAAAGLLAARRR